MEYYLLISEDLRTVDWDDKTYVNAEKFDQFRVTIYNPDNPIRSVPRSTTSTSASRTIPAINVPVAPYRLTPTQEFCWEIKRDKSHYETLKDKKKW